MLLDSMTQGLLSLWQLFIIIPTTYVLVKFLRYRHRQLELRKEILKIPGEKFHPFFGYMVWDEATEANFRKIEALSAKYPEGIMRVGYGPFDSGVSCFHPSTVREVMNSTEPKPTNDMGGYRTLIPWLGEGLITSNGGKWARNRRLLTKTFHFEILKPYTKIFNETVGELIKIVGEYGDREEYFEAGEIFALGTMDSLLKCIFSMKSDCQRKPFPIERTMQELGRAISERFVKPLLYIDWIYYLTSAGRKFKKNCEFLQTYTKDVIAKRKAEIVANGEAVGTKPYLDILDTLLFAKDVNGNGLTDIEIMDECITFLFAGHDTTATAMMFFMYSLCQNPEHQKLCQDEIDRVLDEKGSDEVGWDDFGKFPHFTMCLKESQRLYSTVPLIMRRIVSKSLAVNGYNVPVGAMVEINIHGLHRNPSVWECPDEFDPYRFNPEAVKNMDPFAFVPFSAGSRNCIGQHFAQNELKVMCIRLLREFSFELHPTKEVKRRLSTIAKTEDGLYLKAIRRR